jgi:hypothetical protein
VPKGIPGSTPLCSVPDCEDLTAAHGLCNRHLKRQQEHGDPLHERQPVRRFCEVLGCDRPHLARGWCSTHYNRWRETGTTDPRPQQRQPLPLYRTCKRCGQTKHLTQGFSRHTPTSWHTTCKTCRCAEERERRQADPERARRYHRENRERRNAQHREWLRRIRLETLAAYGGTCACCDEAEPGFLTIDHIDGGGTKHRKELAIPGGSSFYKWLRQHGYPEGYQVLCYNCNCAKAFNPGGCPHELARQAATVGP